MNWDLIQGNWMQFKAGVRGNWVKLTDEDLTRIGGRRDELVKRLQARYGFSKNEAQREIEAWVKTQRYAPEDNSRLGSDPGRPVNRNIDKAGSKAISQRLGPETRDRFALSASSPR